MLDRLKTLPLTILLTILVWMYAEAQFTSTQPEVPITVRVVSGSPDFAVRTMDPVDKHYTNLLNFTVTLQGPKNQIDQIYQESQGMRDNPGEDKLAALTFIPSTDQLRGASGGRLTPNVLQMLNSMEYFRSRGVTVTFASPGNTMVEVDPVTRLHKRVDFRSPMVETATVEPGAVDVQVPSDTLRAMGGGGEDGSQLKILAIPLNEEQLAALPPDTQKSIQVRFVVEYPNPSMHDDRVRVIPAQGIATVKIRRAPQSLTAVNDVPIWVSGPPGTLSRYDVDVSPKVVNLTVTGPAVLLDTLRSRLTGGTQNAGVFAYLDVLPGDKPSLTGNATSRPIRYVLPDGLTLLQSPHDVEFKLTEKPAPGPTTQTGAVH